MPGRNSFVVESGREMGLFFVCERILSCTIRTPLSWVTSFLLSELTGVSNSTEVLCSSLWAEPTSAVLQCWPTYLLRTCLWPAALRAAPLAGGTGRNIVIWRLDNNKKFKRAAWRLPRVLFQLPGSNFCSCVSLAHLKAWVVRTVQLLYCCRRMARCLQWQGSYESPQQNRFVVLIEDLGKGFSYCEDPGQVFCRHLR